MTHLTLPSGVTEMPGTDALNAHLATAGLGVKILIVDLTAGLYFGRRQPENVKTEIEYGTWQRDLRIGESTAAELLGSGTVLGGQPNVTGIGFHPSPQRLPFGDLVQPLLGAGFLDTNPHPACLALVAGPHNVTKHGIITPFADAPPQKYVYADLTDPANPLVITIDVQALWNRLPAPQGDNLDHMRADLIGRVHNEFMSIVTGYDRAYDSAHLWSFTGPGANDSYPIGLESKYGKLIAPGDVEEFVVTKRVPKEHTGGSAKPVEDGTLGTDAGDGMREVTSLRLRDWAHNLAITVVGVPEKQAFVLAHDTGLDPRYSSARMNASAGKPGGRSSNAMLSLVHKI